jgi:hypothetical protein
MEVEGEFNIEAFANEVFKEMKRDGNEFDSFDDYWHRFQMSLQSRGFEASRVAILEGLVMKKVEEMFKQEE